MLDSKDLASTQPKLKNMSKKSSYKSSKKSAFSLIELSIVLIIIGLLVAGVTGGAALIKSAEIRAIMAEQNNYKSLISTFYGNYNYLPGDYPVALAGLVTGNGNGNIEQADGVTTVNESTLAWQQLRQLPGMTAGLVSNTTATANSGVATVTQYTAANINTLIPGSKSKGGAWMLDYIGTAAGGGTPLVANKNALVLLNPVGTRGGVVAANIPCYLTAGCTTTPVIAITVATAPTTNVGILTPQDALQLDTKSDDGIAGVGSIRALNNYVLGASTAYSCITAGANTYETVQPTARSSRNCAMTFDLDI